MQFSVSASQSRKNAYFTSLSNYRQIHLKAAKLLSDSLKILIDDIEKTASEHKKKEKEKEQALKELNNSLKSHEKNLKTVRSQKAEYLKALNELNKQSEKVAELSSKPDSKGIFPNKLPWPVKSRKILHSFGMTKETKYNTTFYNPGIDILTQAGDSVSSVHHGETVYTGWLRGYGNIIIVRHEGNFFTLYGNLDAVFVSKGDKVEKNQLLGTVSPYGFLEGSRLHFEIRKEKTEKDPMKWLS
jgi:septal ring factor EnvC (AmiA/AmiB activator)